MATRLKWRYLNAVDPPKGFEKYKDNIIGPERLRDLVVKAHRVLQVEPPYRLMYMLLPELYGHARKFFKEHEALLRRSAVFTEIESRILHSLGLLPLPAHLVEQNRPK